jgi:NAD-dependent deacetylase
VWGNVVRGYDSRQVLVSADLPPAAELARLLSAHPGAVVFTGAGMSTESGLPDFRSNNLGTLGGFPNPPALLRGEQSSPTPHASGGLWKQNRRFEELASVDALENDYDEHVAFYRWRIEMLAGHEPNDGHRVIAEWQRRGLIGAVVTQNVDGFHTRAGAHGVLELHGTLSVVRCQRCGAERPAAEFLQAAGLTCACGGKRRPGVVLFGEALPLATLRAAQIAATRAPLFIVLGSSLAVAPANMLPEAAVTAGAPLVIVNRDPTPLDRIATLVINASIGETLRAADRLLPV